MVLILSCGAVDPRSWGLALFFQYNFQAGPGRKSFLENVGKYGTNKDTEK